MPNQADTIESMRSQIDALDDELFEIIRKRFNLTKRIMTEEHRMGLPTVVFSHEHEQETLDRLKRLNENSDCPMRGSHIGNIWQTIFTCARIGW